MRVCSINHCLLFVLSQISNIDKVLTSTEQKKDDKNSQSSDRNWNDSHSKPLNNNGQSMDSANFISKSTYSTASRSLTDHSKGKHHNKVTMLQPHVR